MAIDIGATTATPAETRALPSFSFAIQAIKQNLRALATLHLSVWGFFALFAASGTYAIMDWAVIQEMLALDRQSAAAQTWEQWSIPQGKIGEYFWGGEMFTGGWTVGVIYLSMLSFLFAACWVITHMITIRLVSFPRRLTAFEGFLLITSKLLAGLLPYFAWLILVFGALWYRFAPKVASTDNAWGSWRILDILGAIPFAIGITLVLGVCWVLLVPQVVLSEQPKTAWLTSVPLVWKAPGLVLGRWVGHLILWLLFVTALGALVWQLIAGGWVYGLTAAAVVCVAVVVAAASTTWISLVLFPLWQALHHDEPLRRAVPIVFTEPDSGSQFHTEDAEWSDDSHAGDEVDIIIATPDGAVVNITDREEDIFPEPIQEEGLLDPDTMSLNAVVDVAGATETFEEEEVRAFPLEDEAVPQAEDEDSFNEVVEWDDVIRPIGAVDHSIPIPVEEQAIVALPGPLEQNPQPSPVPSQPESPIRVDEATPAHEVIEPHEAMQEGSSAEESATEESPARPTRTRRKAPPRLKNKPIASRSGTNVGQPSSPTTPAPDAVETLLDTPPVESEVLEQDVSKPADAPALNETVEIPEASSPESAADEAPLTTSVEGSSSSTRRKPPSLRKKR